MTLGVFTADRAGKFAVITNGGSTCEAGRTATALCSPPILANSGKWSVTLKIDQTVSSGGLLDIGMVDAMNVKLNNGTSWENWAVTMVCNGTLTARGDDTDGGRFNEGDVVTLSFDSDAKLLRFIRGDDELQRYQFEAYEPHGWCFAVSSGGQATVVGSQAGTAQAVHGHARVEGLNTLLEAFATRASDAKLMCFD